MYKGTVIVKHRGESTNRLAMATFWRTFIMMVNSAHAGGGGGGGAHAHPFTLSTITSKIVVYAPAERADTILQFLLYSFLSLG